MCICMQGMCSRETANWSRDFAVCQFFFVQIQQFKEKSLNIIISDYLFLFHCGEAFSLGLPATTLHSDEVTKLRLEVRVLQGIAQLL